FILNNDNTTADLENSWLEFERGSTAPNSKITWSSASVYFDFNYPIHLSGTGEITGPGAGGLTLTNAGNLTVSTTASGGLAMTSAGAITATYSGGQIISTGTDAITLGNIGDTLALNSSGWAIDATGNMAGIGSIAMDGSLHVAGQCVTADTELSIVESKAISNLRSKPRTSFQFPISNQIPIPNDQIKKTKIKDIKGGEYVLSLNEKTGKIEPARINSLMDMGVKPIYKLTTESGKSIRTTENHPYLAKNNNQKTPQNSAEFLERGGEQRSRTSYPIKGTIRVSNDDASEALYSPFRHIGNCIINDKNEQNKNTFMNEDAFADSFNGNEIPPIDTRYLQCSISEDLVKSGQWTLVKNLEEGQMIAVVYGDKVVWEKITKIKQQAPEQVYDIEVEGTHNFVANGIIAHNTYINANSAAALRVEQDGVKDDVLVVDTAAGNVGIGDASPAALLTVGSGDLFQVNSSGAIAAVVGITNSGALTFSGAAPAISASTAATNITLDAGTTGAVNIAGTSTGGVNIAGSGTGNVNLAGGSAATGCTINNSTGALTCAGDITGGATGTMGYWTRTGTTLSQATANDALGLGAGTITTTGTITSGLINSQTISSAASFTGTGAFASTLTASNGLTLTTGALNLTAASGVLSLSGLSNSSISTGANALTLASGGTSAWTNTSGNLTIGTATSGDLALISAGALNLSAGTASTWTLANVANALNFDSNTLSIDALNNRVGIGTATHASGNKLHVEGQCVTGDTLLPIIKSEEISNDKFLISNQIPNPKQIPNSNDQISKQFENCEIENSLKIENCKLKIKYTRIDQVNEGDYVLSLNEKTGKIEPAKIKGLLDMGVKPIYEI
ncbi:MAG: hypothetical protein Q8O41_04245, partial [Candidatus Methanoperedens sp.]|nr:hypothetical protein [Candidatus Methanoperedens sp.]